MRHGPNAVRQPKRHRGRQLWLALYGYTLYGLVDELFNIPGLSIPDAAGRLQVTYNPAKNNMQRLVELGILRVRDDMRPQYYFADEIINIVFSEDDSLDERGSVDDKKKEAAN